MKFLFSLFLATILCLKLQDKMIVAFKKYVESGSDILLKCIENAKSDRPLFSGPDESLQIDDASKKELETFFNHDDVKALIGKSKTAKEAHDSILLQFNSLAENKGGLETPIKEGGLGTPIKEGVGLRRPIYPPVTVFSLTVFTLCTIGAFMVVWFEAYMRMAENGIQE